MATGLSLVFLLYFGRLTWVIGMIGSFLEGKVQLFSFGVN